MANRARGDNANNHARQMRYLSRGIVMLPTKLEEKNERKRKTKAPSQKVQSTYDEARGKERAETENKSTVAKSTINIMTRCVNAVL